MGMGIIRYFCGFLVIFDLFFYWFVTFGLDVRFIFIGDIDFMVQGDIEDWWFFFV